VSAPALANVISTVFDIFLFFNYLRIAVPAINVQFVGAGNNVALPAVNVQSEGAGVVVVVVVAGGTYIASPLKLQFNITVVVVVVVGLGSSCTAIACKSHPSFKPE
jgi:dolichol kinase